MSSQKKSSTKVGAKKAAPTGQRQFSNLLRSQKTALMKDLSKSQNVAYIATSNTQKSRGLNPSLMRTGMKSELLGTFSSSSPANFEVKKRLRINPLSRDTFQWLPTIAQNFESYKFHYLRVRYETRCSTSSSGSIVISPSYDAADSNAQSATEALLYQNKDTVDFSVWKSHSCVLRPAAMNRLYKSHTCMSDERYANSKQDQKTVDAAQVFICLDGVAAGNAVGKIFLDYDVEFFEPHSPTEPVNQGGAIVYETSVQGNSTLPFTNIPVTNRNEITPILRTVQELVAQGIINTPSPSQPSAIIGQLLKDYDGVVNVITSGTGIVSQPSLYLSKLATGAAGGALDDIIMGGSLGPGVINGTQTTSQKAYTLANGLAGDFIKVASGSASSISALSALMGGISVQ